MTRARGRFDVTLTPQAAARLAIDKQYHGELNARGTGEMLTAGTDVEGSAAYVAIEHVTGALHGRAGTFALQHTGTMTRGAASLSITIVPDSGTGQLRGLAGSMTIEIAEDGEHFYAIEYTLPDA